MKILTQIGGWNILINFGVYIDSWEEESAISARAAKNGLSRHELRRKRYLGSSSEEGAISARAPKKALSQGGFFFSNFVVAALRARMCPAAMQEYFFQAWDHVSFKIFN